MKKLILGTLIISLFGLKPASGQQAFRLNLKQLPPLVITIFEEINATVGEVVNLDTWFNVEGDIPYNRQWKFREGLQLITINNPLYTITGDGVFYLIVTNENGCTVLDSVALNIITGIEEINLDHDKSQSIRVYPNPNSGTFNINISDCTQGYSVEIINSVGVRILYKILGCNNNEYYGTVGIPEGESGTYYLLVKKDNIIIYRQKVILLN